MVLTLTNDTAGHNSKALTDDLEPIIRNFLTMREQKNALDKTIPKTKSMLIDAMEDQGLETATCGVFILMRHSIKPSDATITLKDGRVFKLSDIEGFTIKGKRAFSFDDISTMFGGRSGYEDLKIKETK